MRIRSTKEDDVRIAGVYVSSGKNASDTARKLGLSDHKRVIAAAKRCGVYVQRRHPKGETNEDSAAPAANIKSMLFDPELEAQTWQRDNDLGSRRLFAAESSIRGLWKRNDDLKQRVETLEREIRNLKYPGPKKEMRILVGEWDHGDNSISTEDFIRKDLEISDDPEIYVPAQFN